ncbi:MAG: PadR family transcriptional regulator [Gemmatimonadales bacterium]
MARRKGFDVESFLPLTNVAFEIALALMDGRRHGYAIMQEVEKRTEGRVSLHPGSLYRAIARMVADGLVEEVPEAKEAPDHRKRRFYQLTPAGKSVAAENARRLASQVRTAQTKRLIPEGA